MLGAFQATPIRAPETETYVSQVPLTSEDLQIKACHGLRLRGNQWSWLKLVKKVAEKPKNWPFTEPHGATQENEKLNE